MAPATKKQRLSNGTAATIESTPMHDAGVDLPAEVGDVQEEGGRSGQQQRRSLFIRSLPATTTSELLTELFSESYPIKHATAIIDPTTKQCRGYGFVTFADKEDAQRAREEFNGRVWQDRKLRVEIAEPRHREGEAATHEKTKPEREALQPPKLIVRNLPWSIKGSHQLEKLFQSYGKIKQAYIPQKGPGLMAGFGFVLMRGRKNAEKAIEGVNGKVVDGRTLAVDWAVERDVYHESQQQPPLQNDQLLDGPDEEVAVDGGLEGKDEESDWEDKDGSEMSEYSDTDSVEKQAGVEMDKDKGGRDATVPTNQGSESRTNTLFVRNLPFTCTDEDLEDHFFQFGSIRYARVVMDPGTERSKGTGFVCFYKKEDADACLRGAPRKSIPLDPENAKASKTTLANTSILQNEETDLTGQYTLGSRVLQVSRAVDRSEANRLNEEGIAQRRKRNEDKRRLFLLSEGTISKSKLWDKLSPSERTMREASAKQRKTLVESNPSLHISLTRLSVRNIPRSIGSKELKAIAREAVVGFATDVKEGRRERLSKEELARGGEEMAAAEAARKRSGKGVVKQAKVVFESAGGSKVGESSGAGRSRGYGFIEYHTHRAALMGLRWLNGHAIGYQVKDSSQRNKFSKEEVQDRKKRLIVEFAIENAQVVARRKERENKAREHSLAVGSGEANHTGHDRVHDIKGANRRNIAEISGGKGKSGSGKRKRGSDAWDAVKRSKPRTLSAGHASTQAQGKHPVDEKISKRNSIIGRKRAMRKMRRGEKS